jgi:diguanylate cyclase (GGDEF)-like protein
LIIILLAWGFSAVSRRTHVERERRHQAQLFIRTIELQDVAMRDELTQLFNRRYFFERLRQELSQARHLQRPLAICVMDVNGLKGINDAYGHEAGDVALANLARLLVKCTRSQDIPARLGGDEFGVIMTETNKQGAFSLVERIRRDLEASPVYEQNGQLLKITVSVGVAGFPWGGETVNDLMRRADAYMYAAKAARHGETDPQAALRPGPTRQPEPLPRRP